MRLQAMTITPLVAFEPFAHMANTITTSLASAVGEIDDAISSINDARRKANNANHSWRVFDASDVGMVSYQQVKQHMQQHMPKQSQPSFGELLAAVVHSIFITNAIRVVDAPILAMRASVAGIHAVDRMESITSLLLKKNTAGDKRIANLLNAIDSLDSTLHSALPKISKCTDDMLAIFREKGPSLCAVKFFNDIVRIAMQAQSSKPEASLGNEALVERFRESVLEAIIRILSEGYTSGNVSCEVLSACTEQARRVALRVAPLQSLGDSNDVESLGDSSCSINAASECEIWSQLDVWVDQGVNGSIGKSSAMYRVAGLLPWVSVPIMKASWYNTVDEMFAAVSACKAIQPLRQAQPAHLASGGNDDGDDGESGFSMFAEPRHASNSHSRRLSQEFIDRCHVEIAACAASTGKHLTIVCLDVLDDDVVFDYNRIQTKESAATDTVTTDLIWKTQVTFTQEERCPDYVSPIDTTAHIINGLKRDTLEPSDINDSILVAVVREWRDKFVLLGVGDVWHFRCFWLSEPDFSHSEEARIMNASIELSLGKDEYYLQKSNNLTDYKTKIDIYDLYDKCTQAVQVNGIVNDFGVDIQEKTSSINEARQKYADLFLDRMANSICNVFNDTISSATKYNAFDSEEMREAVVSETMLTTFGLVDYEIKKMRKRVVDRITSVSNKSKDTMHVTLDRLLRECTSDSHRTWENVLDLSMRKYYSIV